MNTDDFYFELPETMIAAYPAQKRDESRLFYLPMVGEYGHFQFHQIEQLLHPDDILVINDSKVIPARLFTNLESGAQVELLLLHEEEGSTPSKGIFNWRSLSRPARKIKKGMKFVIEKNVLEIEILDSHQDGEKSICIDTFGNPDLGNILERHGLMPLPPYILKRREDEGDALNRYHEIDRERYQTVYANKAGSVAAPTAGLHFTHDLIANLEKKGIQFCRITLHVGAGTFLPMKPGTKVSEHQMHTEKFEIPLETAETINLARKEGRRIIPVGTTSVRTLESAYDKQCNELIPGKHETALMIKPGYQFQLCDALITNFHLPQSTLILLVSALAGKERLLDAYNIAVQENYRFFSYGDAMFIENNSFTSQRE